MKDNRNDPPNTRLTYLTSFSVIRWVFPFFWLALLLVHTNISALCHFWKKKCVLYHFHCYNQLYLNTIKGKEKGVRSLDINNYFLFYLQNPQLSVQKVLCPLPNDIAPWSHVTMEIEHSITKNPFLGARTLYHCVFLLYYTCI